MVNGHAHLGLTTPHADYAEVRLSLAGRHQVSNAITAVRLLEEVHRRGLLTIPREAIKTALTDTTWPGRLERVRWQSVDLWLDGAHNPSGARALASYVAETFRRPVPMVIGVMKDKDVRAIVESLAPAASHFLLTAASNSRAMDPVDLERVVREVAPVVPCTVAATPIEAVDAASRLGSPVVVAGSLYLVGEVRAKTS
jgi:dihydrofolate synthase/folylpolyglutamate synthase